MLLQTTNLIKRKEETYLVLEDLGETRTVCRLHEFNNFLHAPVQRVTLQLQCIITRR